MKYVFLLTIASIITGCVAEYSDGRYHRDYDRYDYKNQRHWRHHDYYDNYYGRHDRDGDDARHRDEHPSGYRR